MSAAPEATGQEPRWQGINVGGAPLVAHIVSPTPTSYAGSFLSLCGRERRVKWQPVEDFARPEVFTRCAACERCLGWPS